MTMEAEAGVTLPQAKDCPQAPRNSKKRMGQTPPDPRKKEPTLFYFRPLASRTAGEYIYLLSAATRLVVLCYGSSRKLVL